MKRKLSFAILCLLCVSMTACPYETSTTKETNTVLAVLAAAGALEINGNWNYFNGTPAYVDTCGGFCSNGNVKVGEYLFSATSISNLCQNVTDCGAPTTSVGRVFEFNNSKKILYFQYSGDHPFTPNKFTYIQWIVSGSDIYICPDISNVGSQDTLAKAKDFNNDGVEDYLVDNVPTNLNGGCGALIFWSRLERKP